jgi:hypothetical protein
MIIYIFIYFRRMFLIIKYIYIYMSTNISKRYRRGIISKKAKRKAHKHLGRSHRTSKRAHTRRHKRVKSRRAKVRGVNSKRSKRRILRRIKKRYVGGAAAALAADGLELVFKFPDDAAQKVWNTQDGNPFAKDTPLKRFAAVAQTSFGMPPLAAARPMYQSKLDNFGAMWDIYKRYMEMCLERDDANVGGGKPVQKKVWSDKVFSIAHGCIADVNLSARGAEGQLYGAIGHQPIGAMPLFRNNQLCCDTTYAATAPTPAGIPALRPPTKIKLEYVSEDDWKVEIEIMCTNIPLEGEKWQNLTRAPDGQEEHFTYYIDSQSLPEERDALSYEDGKEKYVGFDAEGKSIYVEYGGRFAPPTYTYRREMRHIQRGAHLRPLPATAKTCYFIADIEGNLQWLIKSLPDDTAALVCFLGDTWDRGTFQDEKAILEKINLWKNKRCVLGNRDANKGRWRFGGPEYRAMNSGFANLAEVDKYFTTATGVYVTGVNSVDKSCRMLNGMACTGAYMNSVDAFKSVPPAPPSTSHGPLQERGPMRKGRLPGPEEKANEIYTTAITGILAV